MNFKNIIFPLIITICLIIIYTLLKTPKNTSKKSPKSYTSKSQNNLLKELDAIPPNPIKNQTINFLTKEEIAQLIIKIYTKELKIFEFELSKNDLKIIENLIAKTEPIILREASNLKLTTKEELIPKFTPIIKEQLNIINEEEKKEKLIISPKKEQTLQPNKPILSETLTIPIKVPSINESNHQELPSNKEKELKSNTKINNIVPFKTKTLKTELPRHQLPIFKLQPYIPSIIKSNSPTISSSPKISPTKLDTSIAEQTISPLNKNLKTPQINLTPTPRKIIPPHVDSKAPLQEQLKNELTNIILELEKPLIKQNQPQSPEPRKEISKIKKEEKKEENKLEPKYYHIDLTNIDNDLNNLIVTAKNELQKEEFENKNYEDLEEKIIKITNIIEENKRKKISSSDIIKLEQKELELNKIHENIENNKDLDIKKEQELLNENINRDQLIKLEEELKNLHLENQLDINEETLNKLEDLEQMNKEQSNIIEKKLLKKKLKKANRTMTITSILALPFIRNKYFLYLTMGLFVNSHLNFFNHILKRKTPKFTPPDLSAIKKGEDSLNEALNITTANINYLNHLEEEALLKYPELINDYEYLNYLNNLKASLLKQEEKMLKKKKVIQKYIIQNETYTRILKKKENKY